MNRRITQDQRGITHATVICQSHRLRDGFHRRYWVMCRRNDHEGPYHTKEEAILADRQHHREVTL